MAAFFLLLCVIFPLLDPDPDPQYWVLYFYLCCSGGSQPAHAEESAAALAVAARPATTFLRQFCPPGSGSGSATLGLICISICVAAGGRSLHMLKKARRNWRWRPAQPLLLCHISPPGSGSGSATLGLTCIPICVCSGGAAACTCRRKRGVTGGGGPPSHYFRVSILPSWIRIRIRNTGSYLSFCFCCSWGTQPAHVEESAALMAVAARPATTFVCQFCPPGSGSGSATLGLICISICVAAGGRSLHMLKKARRNWRWRPAQPVAADPRHWWRFTIHSVLDIVHRTRCRSIPKFVTSFSVFVQSLNSNC